MSVYCDNIEHITTDNENYRTVLFTSPSNISQLVVMSLQPNQEIGLEKHDADQFFRIEKGNGKLIVGKSDQVTYDIGDGTAIVIPAGTWHNIVNTSNHELLKLYTLYSPPQHEDKLIHKNKSDDHEHEHEHEQNGGYKKYTEAKKHYKILKSTTF